MKKKDLDKGYLIEYFYIIEKPIEEGYLHVINIKNNWQIKVYMGENVSSFLLLSERELFDRINGIYIMSMMSLYDSNYAIKIAKESASYISKLECENHNENEDIDSLKKNELMRKIATSSEEDIIEMIANEEINFDYFK